MRTILFFSILLQTIWMSYSASYTRVARFDNGDYIAVYIKK